MTGQITKAVATRDTAPSPRAVLADLLDKNRTAIGLSLPNAMDEDRFRRLLLTAANTTPALFECDPRSFLAAGVACAQLGLEPNDPRGLAYLIPFKDKRRGRVVQLIIGYRGMIDLARRSGLVTAINAEVVYAGDVFSYELGLYRDLKHRRDEDGDEDPETITHAYAVAQIGGDRMFEVVTRRQIERVRKTSQGGFSEYSPWHTHYAEMARKTALRRLCKLLPQTVELAHADVADDHPLRLDDREDGGFEYVADHEDAVEVVASEPDA
jgi:recombination protein RecT